MAQNVYESALEKRGLRRATPEEDTYQERRMMLRLEEQGYAEGKPGFTRRKRILLRDALKRRTFMHLEGKTFARNGNKGWWVADEVVDLSKSGFENTSSFILAALLMKPLNMRKHSH